MKRTDPRLRLEGALCYLTEFTSQELRDPRYLSWLRDITVMRSIYRHEYLMPMRRSSIEAYVRGLIGSATDCFFAVYASARTGAFVGTLRVGHIDWRAGVADIGILIGDRAYWGKGIATDAVRTAGRYCFDELSLRKLTGGCARTNAAMRRCFEHIGFKREAVLRRQLLMGGRHIDHLLYGLFEPEFRRNGGRERSNRMPPS